MREPPDGTRELYSTPADPGKTRHRMHGTLRAAVEEKGGRSHLFIRALGCRHTQSSPRPCAPGYALCSSKRDKASEAARRQERAHATAASDVAHGSALQYRHQRAMGTYTSEVCFRFRLVQRKKAEGNLPVLCSKIAPVIWNACSTCHITSANCVFAAKAFCFTEKSCATQALQIDRLRTEGGQKGLRRLTVVTAKKQRLMR